MIQYRLPVGVAPIWHAITIGLVSSWREVIGHQWAAERLRNDITNARIGHAYLLTGPRHVGKTTLARSFVKALNCTDADSTERPCGVCRSCRLIDNDRHPDVRVVLPQVSGRGKPTIIIEQIRELQRDLNLSATEALYKAAILKQFESTTIGAANAFLKTLEEPPNRVVLILTAIDEEKLLPTITSRCRIIRLRPIPKSTIQNALETRWQVAPEQAHSLAQLSDGRLGWAVTAIREPDLLQERDSHLMILYDCLQQNRIGRFALAGKLASKPIELPNLLCTWLAWWRDLSLLALDKNRDQHVSNIDHLDNLRRLSTRWGAARAVSSLRATRQALWQLDRNANTRLVVENLFLAYPEPELALEG